MRRLLSVLPLVAVVCVAGLYAQPLGAPCDYGYRPGNTWFYRSTSLQGGVYSATVSRDSIGEAGTYWVYYQQSTAPGGVGQWFRIDTACVFDRFSRPDWLPYQRVFVAHADSGYRWIMDSANGIAARVKGIHELVIFGKIVQSKEVLYFPTDTSGDVWYFAIEYAANVGIVHKWTHPNGYDEIIGAIIDGVSYGVTSDVEGSPADAGGPWLSDVPVPAWGLETGTDTGIIPRNIEELP